MVLSERQCGHGKKYRHRWCGITLRVQNEEIRNYPPVSHSPATNFSGLSQRHLHVSPSTCKQADVGMLIRQRHAASCITGSKEQTKKCWKGEEMGNSPTTSYFDMCVYAKLWAWLTRISQITKQTRPHHALHAAAQCVGTFQCLILLLLITSFGFEMRGLLLGLISQGSLKVELLLSQYWLVITVTSE